MKRRTFLTASAVIGGMMSATVQQALIAVANAGEPNGVLNSQRRRCLEALVERIIPATDTPGAMEAGVPDFIELILEKGLMAEDAKRFMAGIDEVGDLSRSNYGSDYIELNAAQQDAILTGLEQKAANSQRGDATPFFQVLKELTLVGYYTSEVGATREIRYLPVPGSYDGCVEWKEGDRVFFFGSPLDKFI